MRILISGSTGLVGTALTSALLERGHDVVSLVRPASGRGPQNTSGQVTGISWDPLTGALDPAADGADAVVNLAGASIAGGRWNEKRKALLRNSRISATNNLVGALKGLRRPPSIFLAASAIGFYGDRGDEELEESSSPGNDFLARLCVEWEAESNRAQTFGARVATLRFGVILARHGGALPQMALPFRFGIGGRVGSGQQWISWVTLRDVVQTICFAVENDSFSGPANVVAPHPARNADFAVSLGRVLHRPAVFPTPAFALRLALGEMADALLLSSQRVTPERLAHLGYRFADPDLLPALRSVLEQSS